MIFAEPTQSATTKSPTSGYCSAALDMRARTATGVGTTGERALVIKCRQSQGNRGTAADFDSAGLIARRLHDRPYEIALMAAAIGWSYLGGDMSNSIGSGLSTAETDTILRQYIRRHLAYGGRSLLIALDELKVIGSIPVTREDDLTLTVSRLKSEMAHRAPDVPCAPVTHRALRFFIMPDCLYSADDGAAIRRLGIPVEPDADRDARAHFLRRLDAGRLTDSSNIRWRHRGLEPICSMRSRSSRDLVAELNALQTDEEYYLALTRHSNGQGSRARWTEYVRGSATEAAAMRRAVAWQAIDALDARGEAHLVEPWERLLASEAFGPKSADLTSAIQSTSRHSEAELPSWSPNDDVDFYRDAPRPENSSRAEIEDEEYQFSVVLCETAVEETSRWRYRIVNDAEAEKTSTRGLIRLIVDACATANARSSDDIVFAQWDQIDAIMLKRPDLKRHLARRMETRNLICINVTASVIAMMRELARRGDDHAAPLIAESASDFLCNLYRPQDL